MGTAASSISRGATSSGDRTVPSVDPRHSIRAPTDRDAPSFSRAATPWCPDAAEVLPGRRGYWHRHALPSGDLRCAPGATLTVQSAAPSIRRERHVAHSASEAANRGLPKGPGHGRRSAFPLRSSLGYLAPVSAIESHWPPWRDLFR